MWRRGCYHAAVLLHGRTAGERYQSNRPTTTDAQDGASVEPPPPPPPPPPPRRRSKTNQPEDGQGTSAGIGSSAQDAAAALVTAVRDRNLHAAQEVIGQHWRDEFAVPIVCLVVLLLVYYSTASSIRNTQRRCESAEEHCKEHIALLRDALGGLTDKWEREMVQRDQQIMEVQKQNMELVRTVDQMTSALKQCAPRGFQS